MLWECNWCVMRTMSGEIFIIVESLEMFSSQKIATIFPIIYLPRFGLVNKINKGSLIILFLDILGFPTYNYSCHTRLFIEVVLLLK